MAPIKLGQSAQYVSEYNPKLLQPIARAQSRSGLLGDSPVPFIGVDIWTAYEVSWLEPSGKPRVAIAEFAFPADSDSIIESKSFKYYLNSFNQTRCKSEQEFVATLEADLSAAAGAKVAVSLDSIDNYQSLNTQPAGICVDSLDVVIETYEPDASILAFTGQTVERQCLYSHLLKSNCPVTGQPDWATVCIQYSGEELSQENFLRYVVSFRGHQDFHENCVEKIFCDLMAQGKLQELCVYARYTRRGGLDINPYRATLNLGGNLPQGLSAMRIARQ